MMQEDNKYGGIGGNPYEKDIYDVQILLTNDDGIYAPGLAAMEHELRKLGDVTVVAPLTEQSGVGHAITYLTPLMARKVFGDDGHHRGWAVEGSPADCVKLAVAELCPSRPTLVVSGMNSGLNAGINVLYSGTVAAAIEGAFFGITSVAVSLGYDDDDTRFRPAAQLAVPIIEQILAEPDSAKHLYNLNIPHQALSGEAEVHVVPAATTPWGEDFEQRTDPRGRNYYWATGLAPDPPSNIETDLSALRAGNITLTPLKFDINLHTKLEEMRTWQLGTKALDPSSS